MASVYGFAGARDRPGIRPLNQFLKVAGRDGADIHDGDPVESGHVAGRLDTGNIGQLQKTLWGCANTESPLFRLAGLEVSKLSAFRVVNKHVAGWPEQL